MALTRIRLLGTTVLGGNNGSSGSGGIASGLMQSLGGLLPPSNQHHMAEDEAVRGRYVII